jgi:putative GTP pyrophosphokinase
MASLNFEEEKKVFETFYSDNKNVLESALNKFVALMESTLDGLILFSSPTGRVKKCEECVSKFHKKYRFGLEETQTPYEIKNHITDLLGIRIVCMYEDEVETIVKRVHQHFNVLSETNKMWEVKNKENHLGYQAWHMDLALNQDRLPLVEYKLCKDFQFELQIRTIIQDAWSTLDHKLQYKKTLPIPIKRRINVLSALFELADKEFVEIRKEIELLSQNAEEALKQSLPAEKGQENSAHAYPATAPEVVRLLESKFPKYKFFPDKVENLLVEILKYEPNLSFLQFQGYFEEHIQTIEAYRKYLDEAKIPSPTPLTTVRHIFYMVDNHRFSPLLFNSQRESLNKWLTRTNKF